MATSSTSVGLPPVLGTPAPVLRDTEIPETRMVTHRRFDRLARLYGDAGVARLMGARIAVFGLGGVGSFATEALARSAVGHLMLVDFDKVCVTNVNRQLQALRGTIGRSKAELLAERVRLINPQAKVQHEERFYSAACSEELLRSPWGDSFDGVIDCIDNMTAKAHLIASCVAQGINIVSSMGAAGKIDPTQIQVGDLSECHGCPMAKALRKILRQKHGFAERGPMGVQVVFSAEPRSWPQPLAYDGDEGFRCVCPHKSNEHSCEERNLIDGTASFVTGSFGLHCAALVVNGLVRQSAPSECIGS